jgi:hypothetical protein
MILGALVLSGCGRSGAGMDCAQRFGGLIGRSAPTRASYTLSAVEYSGQALFDDRRPITDRPDWMDWLASALARTDAVAPVRKVGVADRVFRTKGAVLDPVAAGCRLETSDWHLTRIVTGNPAPGVLHDVSVEP